MPNETNFCIIMEENSLYCCLSSGKILYSGCLAPSNSRHAVVDCIVTTDERWVHHRTPETKSASMGWEGPRFPRSKDINLMTSACKRMGNVCSDHKVALLADFVLQETTVNVESYCDVVTVKSSRQKKIPWAVCERYSVSAKMVGERCAQGFGGET